MREHSRRRVRVVPARTMMLAVGVTGVAVLTALIAGLPVAAASLFSLALIILIVAAAAVDCVISRRAWRGSNPHLRRRLPAAFAIGVRRQIELAIEVSGDQHWHCAIHDYADPTLTTIGLPIALTLPGAARVVTSYEVMPTARGEVVFAPAEAQVRSHWGF